MTLLALFGCDATVVVSASETADSAVESAPVLVLSEAMPTGDPDWIELYNPGTAAVDLAGWGLSDDPAEPFRATLSAAALKAGHFFVATDLGFALDADGETVVLTAPDGTEVDRLELPALEDGSSYGRSQTVTTDYPVAEGTPARMSDAQVEGWTRADFEDAAWTNVTLGIGYDGGEGAGEEANAALGRSTTQSSDGYGYTGVQAVDGEPATFSHTGDGDLEPWWEVDLSSNQSISSITLLNRGDCCPERLYNVVVTVLDDGRNTVWTSEVVNPVAEGAWPTHPGERIDLRVGEVGRYVHVAKTAVNGSYSSEWMSFGEIVVTARPASPFAGRYQTEVAGAEAFVRAGFSSTASTRAVLTMAADDRFEAWIDGVSVAAGQGDGSEIVYALDPVPAGEHVLALHGATTDTDDFLLAPTLRLDAVATGEVTFFDEPTPGEPNGVGLAGVLSEPVPSPPRGFYDAPIEVEWTGDDGAMLVYTVDGSEPTQDSARAEGAISVDTTAILRVAAFREGWAPSRVATHTYLFLQDVVRQPAAPTGFPAVWNSRSEGSYAADYEMDPEIVGESGEELLAGLRSIPTLSVVMDPADLFGDDGIYVQSAERGDAWERPASVEWLDDGGFAEDCGIQIHGYGWRYHSSTLKHAFRLDFKPEYGKSKLEWPLFPDAPVERFDSIVLRAGGSKTWLDFRDPAQAQYLHDSFARDTARDMGKADGHATYVHLYLNGLYWGLYNPVERPDAGFGEEYFGGQAEEYDAINRRTVTNEAIDGNLDAYNELLALADTDLAAVGDMLDLDDLIDYMLIHQYTVNRDGPCCFQHNNMRGLRRRVQGELFRFFVWDMEYSLWDATDSTNIDIDVAGSISHAYARLRESADFRARYAERARMHLTGEGALTPTKAAARYQVRADEIYGALLAESARWGDTYREEPYRRDVEWETERTRLMEEFFPVRTEILIEQLEGAGLY